MSFNLSGIAIDQNYRDNLADLQKQLGLMLDFEAEINFETAAENWKSAPYCDLYFSDQGTLLLLPMDHCQAPWSVEKGNTLTFALSETSMAFQLQYCEDRQWMRSIIEINGDRLADEGSKLPVEIQVSDTTEFIWAQLAAMMGRPFHGIKPNEKAWRYRLISVQRIDAASIPAVDGKSESPRSDVQIPVPSIPADADDLRLSDGLFDALTSEDALVVLNTLSSLSAADMNNIVFSYLLNLGYFHWEPNVRKAAKKRLELYAPADLLEKSAAAWKNSYLKEQDYLIREFYQHPAVDTAEYLVFAQAIRKNYFLNKPKLGLTAYRAIGYGDEIERIFDCYHVNNLEKLSDKITRLQHVTVVNFRNVPKLNIPDTIEKLSALPNLRFLRIADSGLTDLPASIKKLAHLKELNIAGNPIGALPQNVVFHALEKLDVSKTKIQVIDMQQFPALKELWIDSKDTLKAITFQHVSFDFVVTSGKLFRDTYKNVVGL